MGYILNIECNRCDYKKEKLCTGGGRSDYNTYCGVLALNTEIKDVDVINNFDYLNEISGIKSIYKPYYKPEMFKSDGNEGTVGLFDDIEYKCTGNYCPKCEQYKLEIISGGCWD